jgi:hypothetical protein
VYGHAGPVVGLEQETAVAYLAEFAAEHHGAVC